MRCKHCKEVFVVKAFNQKYCMINEDCITAFLTNLNKKRISEWRKEKKVRQNEAMTVQDWLKKAQEVFNDYIRQRDKGKPCISCKNPKPKKVNAGHYFSSGGHKAVTFDERNVHLQCEKCNSFLSGNLIPYRENLIELIGIEEFEDLTKKAHATANYTREELKEIWQYYKNLLIKK